MGIGGGSSSAGVGLTGPASPGFFLGGGGGFFFAAMDAMTVEALPPAPWPPGDDVLVDPAYDPTLSATPYLSFRPLALFSPAATWSPWRWRKLLTVPAADLASDRDTDDGSLWNADAVLSAACFCCQEVPSAAGGVACAGGDAAVALVVILEKRFCSSLVCALLAPGRGRGGCAGGVDAWSGELAGLGRPMPSAGTDTPAAPRRFTAPWLSMPLPLPVWAGLVCVGLDRELWPEFVLGGNLGGRAGDRPPPPPPPPPPGATTTSYDGGALPSAPSLLGGGGGR